MLKFFLVNQNLEDDINALFQIADMSALNKFYRVSFLFLTLHKTLFFFLAIYDYYCVYLP